MILSLEILQKARFSTLRGTGLFLHHMKLIGITTENTFAGEPDLIALLLDCGLAQMHIRKPGYLSEEIATLLHQIPEKYHSRLILHDHFELAVTFAVGGLHLNRRNPLPPASYRGTTGRSCHSLEEVRQAHDVDYCFLSPIFDSLSKKGYSAAFPTETLRRAGSEGIIDRHVYALGGITPERLPQLQEWGFGGAAMLGYLWEETSPEKIKRRMQQLTAYIHP